MRRFLPLLLLVVFAAAGVMLLRGIGWSSLGRYQGLLTGWVTAHPVGSVAAFRRRPGAHA